MEELNELRQTNIGRFFLRAHRDFSERAVEKLRALGHDGLSLAHTNLLMHLDTQGTRLSVLAERAGITKQAMGNLAGELEGRGYIERQLDPSDKRAVLVSFTPQGWQFLQHAHQVKLEIEQEYRSLLGDHNFALLRQLLETLVNAKTS